MAGIPSNETIIHSCLTNGIKNNPITKRDVEICDDMLGPSSYAAKGKTTRTKLDAIDTKAQMVEVPLAVRKHYNNVKISTDVMHVNDIPFLTSVSHDMHYGTSLAVDNLTAPVLERGLRNAVRKYNIRGFNVVVIILDTQFKSLKERNKVGVPINLVL